MYYQTDFEFSESAKKWARSQCNILWNKSFDHEAEYNIIQNSWQISPIGRELRLYLKKYNLNFNYAGINIFLSNTEHQTKTNPHIDVLHFREDRFPIKSRFNVMILGNTLDPMFWWKDFTYGNPNHINKTFFTDSGVPYKSLAVPGETVEERWNYLGEPTSIKSNLLVSGSFVNTFSAHALEISAGPRLIVSVAIDQYLEDIIDRIDI